MQAQQETNWCWAANTASVSLFFDQNSRWNQCSVATACLGSSCCSAPGPCNQPFVLDVPLSQTNNLQGSAIAAADSRADLQAQIDSGAPVCCHISWGGQGGHFVAVSGYDWSTDDVIVDDPLYGPGPARVPYNTFVNSYRGSGTWDYSYHTQA
ncbi:MAG: C39 family peptidase [Rhodoferax sp.]|nr:C39 family peptidase [Rhodoferax sp.]